MSSKQTIKVIKSKLCRAGTTLLLLGTLGIGFVHPAQASPNLVSATVAYESGSYRLPGRSIHTFTRHLARGEFVGITVDGDTTTNLDVYVYDPYGNLVAKDDYNTDYCLVSFTARYTGAYRIRVVNRGRTYNHYDIEFAYV